MRLAATLALLGAALVSPALAAPGFASVDGVDIRFEQVGAGFDKPVFLLSPPTEDRVLVVEQTGRVRELTDGEPGAVFLDVSGDTSHDYEQGLLGLAFDPKFAENGRFFVDVTNPAGDTEIRRYQMTADGKAADPASGKVLLTIDQPESNHNGGWIGFGPDGYLYIGMGDGGGGGDQHGPTGNGQNKDVLLGKMLRIDVSGDAYTIPPTNPFANGGGKPEIYLYGLRNPWRNSFDGDLFYIADVGQEKSEELDVLTPADVGANMGWHEMEGDKCYPLPFKSRCDATLYHPPVMTYSHDDGCSITGGYVYRGAALPALDGRYFYGDYCWSAVRALRYADGKVSDKVDFGMSIGGLGPIMSFGLDSKGELYVLIETGEIFKLVPAT